MQQNFDLKYYLTLINHQKLASSAVLVPDVETSLLELVFDRLVFDKIG